MNNRIRKFRIRSNGSLMGMGTYEARDEHEARDVFARDAGYKNYSDLLARVPGSRADDIAIEEVVS